MAIFLRNMLKNVWKQQKKIKENLAAAGRAEQEIYYSGYKDVIRTVITQNACQVTFSTLIYQFKVTPDDGDVFVKSTVERSDAWDSQQKSWTFTDFERPEEAIKQCIHVAAEEHLKCCERISSEKKGVVAGSRKFHIPLVLFCTVLLCFGLPALLTEPPLKFQRNDQIKTPVQREIQQKIRRKEDEKLPVSKVELPLENVLDATTEPLLKPSSADDSAETKADGAILKEVNVHAVDEDTSTPIIPSLFDSEGLEDSEQEDVISSEVQLDPDSFLSVPEEEEVQEVLLPEPEPSFPEIEAEESVDQVQKILEESAKRPVGQPEETAVPELKKRSKQAPKSVKTQPKPSASVAPRRAEISYDPGKCKVYGLDAKYCR